MSYHSMQRTKRLQLPVLLCCAVLTSTRAAVAEVVDYANPTGAQDFSVGGNWTGGVAPGELDQAFINGVDGVTDYAYVDTFTTVDQLLVAEGAGTMGGLELRSGAQLFSITEDNGGVDFGDGAGALGYLRINDGAFFSTVGSIRIGRDGGSGIAVQDGGQVILGAAMRLANGENATGTYTMNGGSLEMNSLNGTGLFQIGGAAGASGTFYMNGGTLSASERTRLGRVGAYGGFIQTAGDVTLNNEEAGTALSLGTESDGVGEWEISGGSLTVGADSNNVVIGSNNGVAQGILRIVGDTPSIEINAGYDQRAGGILELEIGTGISPVNVNMADVLLNGTLSVSFTETPTVGQQFTIMNYGQALSGTFAIFDTQVDSPMGANTVGLTIDYGTLTTSSIVLSVDSLGAPPSVPGDYNNDTVVDIDDFAKWKENFGSTEALDADGNDDGVVNLADYTVWRNNLGAGTSEEAIAPFSVPEPGSVLLLSFLGLLGVGMVRQPRAILRRTPASH